MPLPIGMYEPMPFPAEAYLVIVGLFALAMIIYGLSALLRKSGKAATAEESVILPIDMNNLCAGNIRLPKWLVGSRTLGSFKSRYVTLDRLAEKIGVAGFAIIDSKEKINGILLWHPPGLELLDAGNLSEEALDDFDPSSGFKISFFGLSLAITDPQIPRRMAESAIEWAREHAIKKIILGDIFGEHNAPTLTFWEDLGFEKDPDGRGFVYILTRDSDTF